MHIDRFNFTEETVIDKNTLSGIRPNSSTLNRTGKFFLCHRNKLFYRSINKSSALLGHKFTPSLSRNPRFSTDRLYDSKPRKKSFAIQQQKIQPRDHKTST